MSRSGARPDGPRARAGRPARPGLRPDWHGRLAAGLVLSAGVASLVHIQERAETARRGIVTYAVAASPRDLEDGRGETRRRAVDILERSAPAMDHAWEAVTASVAGGPVVASSGAMEAGFDVAPASREGRAPSVRNLVAQAESLIRRYPWPTFVLGVGAGFLLARRRR